MTDKRVRSVISTTGFSTTSLGRRVRTPLGVPVRPGQTGPSVADLAPGKSVIVAWRIQTLVPIDAATRKQPLFIHGEATDNVGEAYGIGIVSRGEGGR